MDLVDRANDYIDSAMAKAEDLLRGRRESVKTSNLEIARDCCGCGEPINPVRLAALPDAVRCIECQSDFERRL